MSKDFTKGFIYIASPYSHPDKAVMQERYEDVLGYVGHALGNGLIVYSPIVHHHEVAQAAVPLGPESLDGERRRGSGGRRHDRLLFE